MASGNGDKQALTVGFIKTWLPILILVIAMATAWVTMGMQIEALQDDQKDQAVQNISFATDMVGLKIQLARIETNRDYIRKEMESRKQ